LNFQELKYFVAVAEHKHFGRAAAACHVSQPTLSGQLRKLEDHLGLVLFERTNKRVALTPMGKRLLVHARESLREAELLESTAKAAGDPLVGPLKLGIIPTVAPYLMPLILAPLREACPGMSIELWEDLTGPLLSLVSTQRLDAALIATDLRPGTDLTGISLFVEPFLAALPESHPLAVNNRVSAKELSEDLLVLADGHCLADQSLSACGKRRSRLGTFQASSLDTLVNLVAAGYGTTLIPGLASGLFRGRNIVLRPLKERMSRTIRLASRASFPRPQALRALGNVIRQAVSGYEADARLEIGDLHV
jgi:LysR family transcriptional regulator, hydrogen peroxide-inducible genes activator